MPSTMSDLKALHPICFGGLGTLLGGAICLLPQHIQTMAAVVLVTPILFGLVWSDLKSGRLPDRLTYLLIGSGLALHGVGAILGAPFNARILLDSIGGAIIGYGLIWALRWAWLKRRRIEAIGLGDAKLLAGMGAWLGALALPYVLLIASFAGIIWALGTARQTALTERSIPFGPALCLGFMIVWAGSAYLS
jgi:leader peptidase (prepilin peptidase) / N-methyltransferase